MTPDSIRIAHQCASAGDLQKAIALLNAAGDRGDAPALAELATWYLLGRFAVRDLARARVLLRRAVAIGHADAALMEIALTANGSGSAADWQSAVALLGVAAQNDYIAVGQLKLLGEMALKPDGMPQFLPRLEQLSASPRVHIARGFLSAGECLHIANVVHTLLTPSVVVDPNTGRNIVHPIRTSDAAVIGPTREDLVIGAVNRRIAALSNTAMVQGEPLSVLRYSAGQQYRPHFDALPSTTNQRTHTVLLYLNDGFAGGETYFKHNDLHVKARAGDAILFRNTQDDGALDPASQHAGLPVRAGVKWLATRWIREQPFDVWEQTAR